MTPRLEETIAELERLDKGATAGPWKNNHLRHKESDNPSVVVERSSPYWSDGKSYERICTMSSNGPLSHADTALIASMRNALPDLLAILKAQRGALEEIVHQTGWYPEKQADVAAKALAFDPSEGRGE